ncbi:MAG: hypothetical protein WCO93_07390 [bacterium]
MTALVLWVIPCFNPPSIPPPYGPVPLYDLLYSLIHNLPLLSVILGFILVVVEMYWLNQILSGHELVQKNSSLAALIFILVMSFYPEALILNPVNINVLLLLVIIYNLMISYKKPEHLDRIFAAGFFTSVASMFYFPFIIWCGLIFISFVLFRSGKWRQWISALLGLLTPYLYLAVTYFWYDQLTEKINAYVEFFHKIFVFPNPFQIDFLILGGMTLLSGLYGLSVLFSGPVEKTVEIRAKMNLFLWTIPFSILTFFLSGPMAIFHPLTAAPAFSLVIVSALQGIRKPARVEWFLWLYFFMILANTLYFHRIFYHQ